MSFDFGKAFACGMAEWGGTLSRTTACAAKIGPDGRTLCVAWIAGSGRFKAVAGNGSSPALEFGCATDGWEEWQAVDAGRDFAKRAYEIAGRLGK